MKNKWLSHMLQLGSLAGLLFFTIQCKPAKETPTPGPNIDHKVACNSKFVIANVTGAFPSQTSYVQPLSSLNITTLTTKNALEIGKAATFWGGSGSIFSTEFGAPATLRKYRINSDCMLEEEHKMLLPGTNTFSSIEFVSPTEAVASTGGGLAQVVVFDPSSMRITGYINMKETKLPGVSEVYYPGSAVVGNYLFLAIASFNATFTQAFDSCHIAVIDLKAKTLVRVISDARTGHAFGNGSLASVIQKDQNGDVYIQGMGYAAGTGRTVPSGILRIKSGETSFDPTYFFDLNSATGKNCFGLYHFGQGQTFTLKINDDSKLYSKAVCEFQKINLDSKTTTPLNDLPAVKGTETLMRKMDDNTIVFNVSTDNSAALYQYTFSKGEVKKMFDMPGSCYGLEKIQ